eukprot:5935656-Pyramimonas_sp.AAC.1
MSLSAVWNAGRHTSCIGSNGDLWARLKQALIKRGSSCSDIEVVWVPSHLDEDPDRIVNEDLQYIAAGNICADKEAGAAAARSSRCMI